MRQSIRDWGGLATWFLLFLIVLFVETKHIWFDSIGSGDKALFWSTLLGPLVAAIGWYVAANQNYSKSRQLELDKEERERKGVLRQANLILRLAIRNLTPFFFSFMTLQLNDVLSTWNRLTDLLHDRGSALAFTHADYRALEAFWSRLGRDIVLAQEEFARWAEGRTPDDYPSTPKDSRVYLGQVFESSAVQLLDAISVLGDTEAREDFRSLQKAVQDFDARNGMTDAFEYLAYETPK